MTDEELKQKEKELKELRKQLKKVKIESEITKAKTLLEFANMTPEEREMELAEYESKSKPKAQRKRLYEVLDSRPTDCYPVLQRVFVVVLIAFIIVLAI